MRAIVVMFDSLNRRFLPPYGDTHVHAPNFARLAARSATFDTCYAGSMPCMPARREMHTGRYNFLHRSWGPIEPFDDSVPELLRRHGVYTHLISDHQHYWEDGGATYHTRFSSHEFFRGQEGDPWKADFAEYDRTRLSDIFYRMKAHDRINRTHMASESDHSQTKTFDAGLEFIQTNADQDRWMVQIETFDPHEPFFSYGHYHALYPDNGEEFDWPPYARVTESEAQEVNARNRYLALLSMCDRNLGRVLDLMDEKDMWSDTMLIVCTDHGYMLGERGWWGKSVMPWYDETIHTPLFIWDPRSAVQGERRSSLVQTIDFGPTLMEFFGLPLTADMQGRPLAETIANDTPVREAGLFGAFGGHVSVTDGRYVYMRASVTPENAPLIEHTLMPTHMRARFAPEEFANAELVPGFAFTKGAPVMRMPGWAVGTPWKFGTLLYDLEVDPEQTHPLYDPELELKMVSLLVGLMRASEAPPSQFERLGLPVDGPVEPQHLLAAKQRDQIEAEQRIALRVGDFEPGAFISTVPLQALLDEVKMRDIIAEALPDFGGGEVPDYFRTRTILELASMLPNLPRERLEAMEAALQSTSAAKSTL